MYCQNCGKDIDDKAAVCPYCGVSTGRNLTESNTLAVVGFILSFFSTIVGLIISILGYKKSIELNGKGKGLATAGIVISSVTLVISLIILFSSLASMFAIFDQIIDQF